MRRAVFGELCQTGFGTKGAKCHGGKKSKQRFTVALIVNADGEKELYGNLLNQDVLKVLIFLAFQLSTTVSQRQWMTDEILNIILTKLNRRFSSQNRNVAFLLDNAGCHPHELKGKYSIIQLIFLPPNTT